MSVKGYLALLVGVFVAGLLVITVVERNLAGDLGGALDAITREHYPKVRAARELRAAALTEQHALADFFFSGKPAAAEQVRQAQRDFQRRRGELAGTPLDQRQLAVLAEIDGLQRDHQAAARRAVELRRAGRLGELERANEQEVEPTGQRLEQAARPGDVPGRWGGEEFLVVLPQTGPEEAAALGEQARRTIAAAPVALGPAPLRVTASVGVASGAGDGWEGLVRRADTGLYAAKEGGRNRVVTGPPAELGTSTPKGRDASR